MNKLEKTIDTYLETIWDDPKELSILLAEISVYAEQIRGRILELGEKDHKKV